MLFLLTIPALLATVDIIGRLLPIFLMNMLRISQTITFGTPIATSHPKNSLNKVSPTKEEQGEHLLPM